MIIAENYENKINNNENNPINDKYKYCHCIYDYVDFVR